MEFERITIAPATMRGVPCIRWLRNPVATVIGQLAAGRTPTEILTDFPDLEADDITASLEHAAATVQEREPPLTRPAWSSSSTPTCRHASPNCSGQPVKMPSLRATCFLRRHLRRDPRSSLVGGSIVISHDTDFGTLLAMRRLTSPSFILIRSSDPVSADEVARLLLTVMAEALHAVAIVTFARGHLRSRRLPLP
jgi:uncharacterized protein (DUF433 family)